MNGAVGVSVNNRFLLTGGTGGTQDDVLGFRKEDQSWTQIGKLSVGRNYHGVSVVNAADVTDYCTSTRKKTRTNDCACATMPIFDLRFCPRVFSMAIRKGKK